MKKIFYLSTILSACLFLAGVTSCSNAELDTDQYPDNTTKLASYGPNPVMRGGTLRFFGSNLQNITEVNVPGISSITDIEVVTSGSPSEIRVQLPSEGEEIGTVTLIAKDGTTFKTQTELKYSEPIVFDDFSPKSAMPGDVITVTGDYMNLVESVTFEGGTAVNEVEHINRHTSKVTVPSSATTGKIILSDEGTIANLLYSENELTIGDPTVTRMTVSSAKPDGKLTITGSYLDMIKEISFAGDVIVSDFTLSDDHKTISLNIPAAAQSGEVTAVSFAGKGFKAGDLAMIKPTKLSISPSPVKAGKELTVSGSDLDIVTTVDLPGAAGIDFTYKDSKIAFTVPAKATEGDITLTMANSDAVTVAYTLVHPTVTAILPVSMTAGESFTVTGTDLDLITGVTLGGKDVDFDIADGTITVTTSATSVSGKVVLTLANGEKIEPSQEITLSYDSYIVVNDMPSSEHIGATVTLKGSNFMMIENIFIGDAKVTQYISRSDEEMSFIMPYNSVGTYSMYFHLLSGDVEACPQQIEVLLEINYITAWEGECAISWNDGGRVYVPATKFEGVKAGCKMRIYYTMKDKVWSQAQFNYGNWSGINFDDASGRTFDAYLKPEELYGEGTYSILERCEEVVLTQTILNNIDALKGGCEGLTNLGIIIQGQDMTITKIEILQEIPQETTIWEGSEFSGANYDSNLELGSEDAWTNAGLYDGATVMIYFTTTDSDNWQIQVFSGHWDKISFDGFDPVNQFNSTTSPSAASDGLITFSVSGENFTNLTTKKGWGSAMILQGKLCTFTKIAFK